jgi:arginyl-tRNA synthetase
VQRACTCIKDIISKTHYETQETKESKGTEEGSGRIGGIDFGSLSFFSADEEKELIFELSKFPLEVISCVKAFSPTGMMRYAISIVGLFCKFYDFLEATYDIRRLFFERYLLCLKTLEVIKKSLGILKINIP